MDSPYGFLFATPPYQVPRSPIKTIALLLIWILTVKYIDSCLFLKFGSNVKRLNVTSFLKSVVQFH